MRPTVSGGALTGVRLTDVPLKTRRLYGRLLLDRVIKELGPFGLDFAAELHKAVEEPSDRVYWVTREEAVRVLGEGHG